MMPENLRKSRHNKVIAGVCGGIAEYFKVDATLVRLAWALAFFIGGSGFILYVLAMFIMPEEQPAGSFNSLEPGSPAPKEDKPGEAGEGEGRNKILGIILIGIGGYFLLERFFPYFFNLGQWWPVLLIAIGLFILFKGRGGR